MSNNVLPASRADLHSHTTASDGSLSPRELMQSAAQRGVLHLAITDHDTTAAHAEARAAALELNIGFIPGVEITCESAGTEVHLLGLGIDGTNASLQALCGEMQNRRVARFEEMYRNLVNTGLRFELPVMARGLSPSRPLMARALVKAGLASDLEEAFARYLRKGRPGYVPHRREPVKTAIDAVHAAGGVAILAHPGLYVNSDETISEAIASGADGLECVHPDHDEQRTQRFTARARKLGLLISGGADYHGPGHARSHLFGKRFCPHDEFIRLQMAMAGRSNRHSL